MSDYHPVLTILPQGVGVEFDLFMKLELIVRSLCMLDNSWKKPHYSDAVVSQLGTLEP